MNTEALKAGLVALSAQVLTLLVGFGLVNNTQAAKYGSLSVAIVSAAFLISHALHSKNPVQELVSDLSELNSQPPVITGLAPTSAPEAPGAPA